MSLGRDSGDATVMNKCVFVAGGTSNARPLSSVEKYDPIKNEWINLAAMNRTHINLVLENAGGFLYAMGWNEVVEKYDPLKNEWHMVSGLKFRSTELSHSQFSL